MKALLRKTATRTVETLWDAIGNSTVRLQPTHL